MTNLHISVLYDEILEWVPKNALTAFDGTLGGAGHTRGLLQKGLTVVSSDLDSGALEEATKVLPKDLLSNWTPVHASFDTALEVLPDNSIDYITADLGFSSNQLEAGQRGFSYLKDSEVLDLRYNTDLGLPAWHKISQVSEQELSKILFTYSGEKLARIIAKKITELSKLKRTLNSLEVATAITSCIPKQFLYKKNSILSRVWQALRIWTNDEFAHLEKLLDLVPHKLKPGGRCAIISFHSLEDKLVTKRFRTLSKPVVLDEYGNTVTYFELLTKQAVLPTSKEIDSNPRSRSAMLRVLQKNPLTKGLN